MLIQQLITDTKYYTWRPNSNTNTTADNKQYILYMQIKQLIINNIYQTKQLIPIQIYNTADIDLLFM